MQPGRARTSGRGVPLLPLARWVGWVAPVCPTHGVLVLPCPSAAVRVCSVLGHLAPVHRCAGSVCCVACAVSWATWLLFTGVPARCAVLRVRCPGPPGSCSPVCPLGGSCSPLFCVCGVLGLLAPVHRCARSLCCFVCAVSWASWILFTVVPARCVVLRVRCPGPPGSCSPVCPLGVLCCVCGVLGHLAPVHRCARSVCCFACAVSWASWLLFTGAPTRCVVLRVRCPGPPGSCSPVRPLGVLFCVLFCVCGVLGLLAPVHRCARSVCCVACAVSWASWLLFTGVPAPCVLLRVRCPGPPGSCSPVCPRGVLCCLCGVLGLLAPVHRCARAVCCVACAVSWASWLLFTGAPARCVVLRVRCPGPPGSCSPVCPLGVLFCVCGVLGLLAPVHRCARSVCCFAFAVSWASWLLFTGVPARCVVLRVRCPGPPGSCSPVCPLGVLCCVCGVLGLLAPVHRCARSVCFFACAVSWATWLLFTGAPAGCVVLRVRCPWPPGSCSPVRPLGVLFCVCGVLGHLAPVHRCARSVCCFACAVSWASWLLLTGVPARCVVLRVRCSGPLGSCSPVCPLGVLCCVCGVLGHLAPVHRCARAVCCFACAVSWASWLLFTGVPARCVVLRVRCPGPLGSCSPVRPLGVLCCVYGVLDHLAPVHRCACAVCCVACTVSCASWLLFTGAPARCVVLRVRCPGPPGSCSPVCPPGVLCRACGVLGPLAPVHPCARSVGCVVCTVSSAALLLFTGVLALCVVLWVARGVLLCGAWLRGAHSSIRTAAVRSRQGLGTLRVRTRPSGRRPFVAGRGWVPSGRALVHPDGSWRACACSLWPGRAGRPPGRVVVRLTFSFGCFVFLPCLAPSGLWWPPSSSLLLPFLVALRSFVWPLAALRWFLSPPPPPLLCLAVFVAPAGCLGFSFFFFLLLPPCAPVVSGFLWFFGPGCPGPRRCALFALLAFRFSALRALSPLLCFPPGRWLLPGGCCPPPFVSRGFRRCRSVLCAVCCAVLCVPGCGAAPRCCPLCRPVLCCCVLCCFVALVWCRCLLRRALWRCSSPWGPVLCGAVFCGVHPRCVLCAVCVLSWRGAACCCSPLCFVLCVPRGAVLCVPCPLCSVQCCALLCWCARVVLFVGCVLLLAPGAVVRCCVLCCFLWCAVVRRWVWWPVVVCWWRVSVSVSLSGRVVCFPVVGVVCCGALLSCVVFCGAVLSRGAVLLCSAVVLRCCWGLFCPPVACRAVLCCAVCWLCCFLPGGGVCVLWCSFPRAVRSLSSPLCALRCLAVLAVVPCFPVSCAVALCCCVVLCCRALLSLCGAVCDCFALLRPVVRRRAVLCCAVGCLCCLLPGGGVCVLRCPFPPCRHAQKKHQSSYMSPRVGGGVVAGMPWWLRCPGLDAAHGPPAVKGR